MACTNMSSSTQEWLAWQLFQLGNCQMAARGEALSARRVDEAGGIATSMVGVFLAVSG
jgi:hypothetical protein